MSSSKHIHWGSLLLGILFVLASLIAFRDPVGNLQALVMVFAIFAILKGLYEIFLRNSVHYFTGTKATMLIVVGVLDIIVGIFFLLNINLGVVALPIVFAVWFLVDSIFGLFTADIARQISNGYYWFQIIVNVLGIIVGIMLLLNPLSAALTLSFLVGFYFMLFGITNIVEAFAR